MIRKISVENYRSFGDKIEIELGKFNVLVGPNNSGKSNFIDVLSFISDLAHHGGISSILSNRGGYKSVIFDGEEEKDIRIEIESENGIEYTIIIGNPSVKVNPVKEILKFKGKDFIKAEDGRGKFWNHRTEKYEEFYYPGDAFFRRYKVHAHYPHFEFEEFWKGAEFYRFDLKELRAKQKIGIEKINREGSNLSSAIHYIRNKDRELYEELEEKLRTAIPEVKYLETPPTSNGKANLELIEKDLKKRIDLSEMADGTLWLLAHIFVFISLKIPTLVCFEEPNNYIHPSMLELLIEIFKSVESQVVVTTHNPFFVNLIDPEDLIIFEKRGGKTICRRIKDPKEMKERTITDIPLGEIWYSGEIGGVPP